MGGKWFTMWLEDVESILETMIRNMASDIDAGYDYFGNSIKKQRAEIDQYKKKIDDTLDMFKDMEDDKVERWCYYEMKKKGAIG